MNEAFRSATAKSECFPVAFLNVSAPPDSFDINVSPDKRVVMFADEVSLTRTRTRTLTLTLTLTLILTLTLTLTP